MILDVRALRNQFPALTQVLAHGGRVPVFFDNPAGTQVPQQVIDAVSSYYRQMNANQGGVFVTSQRTNAMLADVRQKMAAFLNAPSADEIVFGPNMTTLNFALSRALGVTLTTGDEIILTRMDHDANVEPWRRLAADHDLVIRWVDIDEADCTLDLSTLHDALNPRTRLVAVTHASNAVGTINPIADIVTLAHNVGALVVVDAVQSAPHVPLDVQALGCDFLLCSAYKFYGPHVGILWGRYDLLASLPVYKVRPAADVPPQRWETGTQSHETIAGVGATLDYIASVGERYGTGATGPDVPYPQVLRAGMQTIAAYEQGLVAHLIERLQAVPGVSIAGITDPVRYGERVPTVAFIHAQYTPAQLATYLNDMGIYVWAGNYYAVEIMQRLQRAEHGMVRVGPVHYNTHSEIDRLGDALMRL